jgi:hypothetical protein
VVEALPKIVNRDSPEHDRIVTGSADTLLVEVSALLDEPDRRCRLLRDGARLLGIAVMEDDRIDDSMTSLTKRTRTPSIPWAG